jgi:hypothetical protein
MVFIIEGVEVLEITCGDEYGGRVWHIKRSMPTLHVQCSTLQISIKQYHTSRIISKPITIGVLVPIYSSMSSQFSSAPLKLNKF